MHYSTETVFLRGNLPQDFRRSGSQGGEKDLWLRDGGGLVGNVSISQMSAAVPHPAPGRGRTERLVKKIEAV